MDWIVESTLAATSRCERERSLALEKRLMLVMSDGAPGRSSVELLKYQAEHGHREGSNALNR